MIRKLMFAMVGVLVSATASADYIGLYAGLGYWGQDFGGDVISKVSAANELGVGGSGGSYIYVAFEHPIPLLPNIRIARTAIDDTGSGTLTSNFTYEGQTFTSGQHVTSEINLTNTDVTLYYEVIDVGMDLDLGITGRFEKGEVAVNSARRGVSVGLPMGYARARFNLPFTGTYLDGNVNFISWSGNQVADYALAVGWQTHTTVLPDVGVELGYRRFSVDVSQSDADVNVDMAVKGVFLNLTTHF